MVDPLSLPRWNIPPSKPANFGHAVLFTVTAADAALWIWKTKSARIAASSSNHFFRTQQSRRPSQVNHETFKGKGMWRAAKFPCKACLTHRYFQRWDAVRHTIKVVSRLGWIDSTFIFWRSTGRSSIKRDARKLMYSSGETESNRSRTFFLYIPENEAKQFPRDH